MTGAWKPSSDEQRGDVVVASPRLEHCALGEVHQLADVAGPRRLDEVRGVARVERRRLAAVLLRELHGEVREQRQDVLAAGAQGRHLDHQRGEAEVKVVAQHLGRRCARPEIARERDDADVVEPRAGGGSDRSR
jgi:hypothetical protein